VPPPRLALDCLEASGRAPRWDRPFPFTLDRRLYVYKCIQMEHFGPGLSAERIAYDYLRERILSGAFPGGAPILQQEIANHLGVSRIPVRDALKHLSAEGLVIIESNRRVLVTKTTLEDVREIFSMRSVLEGLSARMGAENWQPPALQKLSLLVERMESAEADPGEWLRVHEEFHRLIWRQAGMSRLQRELQRLSAAVEPYLRVFLAGRGMGELEGSKHRALLDAIKTGDPDVAERAMRDHIDGAFSEIWDLINDAKSPPSSQRRNVTGKHPSTEHVRE
jgi:DNA-binding GntR family transcriptional regulator